MKIFEGGTIPEGTIVGFQVMWKGPDEEWKTVSEVDYYRALHNEHALVHGRLLLVQHGPLFTNEDGIIKLLENEE